MKRIIENVVEKKTIFIIRAIFLQISLSAESELTELYCQIEIFIGSALFQLQCIKYENALFQLQCMTYEIKQ